MSLRQVLRETKALGDLMGMRESERQVLFYAEDSYTYAHFQDLIESLVRLGVTVAYATSDPEDPLFSMAKRRFPMFYIKKQLRSLMKRINGSVVVMTMPDLGQFHIPKPETPTVYVFHSMNSVHLGYRTGAFDHYDVFACVGPHHQRELEQVRSQRGLAVPKVPAVGHPLLDRIIERSEEASGGKGPREALLAPSWGPNNILESIGAPLIRVLSRAGFKVTVRPHPQFFGSLYTTGAGVVRDLEIAFGDDSRVEFEKETRNYDSFFRSDLLVSDWSGSALEYAFGRLRPVILFDTPMKEYNAEWKSVGLEPHEIGIRNQIGKVLDVTDVEDISVHIEDLANSGSYWRERLTGLREEHVFNIGASADAGANVIASHVS